MHRPELIWVLAVMLLIKIMVSLYGGLDMVAKNLKQNVVCPFTRATEKEILEQLQLDLVNTFLIKN